MCVPLIQAQKGLYKLIWTNVERSQETFRHLSDTPAGAGGYDAIPPYA